MTNGEKLCYMFPEMHYTLSEKQPRRVVTTIGVCASFDLEWWNAEYQEPTTKNDLAVDAIARAEINQVIEDYMDEQYHVLSDRTRERAFGAKVVMARINELSSVTPQEPRCRDCKWWKDSDGKYRRGCETESKCPINTHTVYCGEGYCYLYEPKADV